MLTVRRIYLYLVAAISLVTVTWSVIGLARLVLSEGIGAGQITGLATLLAAIIVGLPIFLFHWLPAQRLAAASDDERESPVRTLFFYGVMAIGAMPVLSNLYHLVARGLVALVGGSLPDYYPYNLSAAENIAAVLVWTVVWLYLWRQTRQPSNWQAISTQTVNLGLRRLYLLGFSLGGLAMVTWGGVNLLQALMRSLDGIGWRTLVAASCAQLLVGTAIWVVHWSILQRDFHSGNPAEERSVLRKIYLYLAVFIYAVMALSSGVMLLQRLLELALGGQPSSDPLLWQLSTPVPLLIVGALFWTYHRYVLTQDAAQAPEAPRQAGVRRVYGYLVAALGLATLLTGVAGLLTLIIDVVTSPAVIGLSFYRDEVALFVALTLVGTPVWLLPWRSLQQQVTRSVEPEATQQAAEYRSLVRKIYLYLFIFVAALLIFGSAGWFVFHILTALLGADLPDDFLTQVLNALVISLLAAGVWLYHWWAIRLDGQLDSQARATRMANIAVAVIDGGEGQLGQTVLHQLRRALPGVQLKPLGLTPQATTAMEGKPFATAELDSVGYITGSWQALAAGAVEPAIAASSAIKFVIPQVQADWLWVGVKPEPVEVYAQQIARGIEQAIEGETIDLAGGFEAGTWLAAILGVMLFLLVGGGLLIFVLSMM
ncbi:MAG: hypothetical protein KDJ97_19675 [Anaerolineae bacterium]|nr:hypothetical protein [Anaerolineae bacterium]